MKEKIKQETTGGLIYADGFDDDFSLITCTEQGFMLAKCPDCTKEHGVVYVGGELGSIGVFIDEIGDWQIATDEYIKKEKVLEAINKPRMVGIDHNIMREQLKQELGL